MTIYYSPSKQAFYDTSIVNYPHLPIDKIELDEEERSYFIEQVNHNGKTIVLENDKLTLIDVKPVITWQSIRDKRNDLLDKSDYTQVPDFPGDKEAWAIYRQKLRDIPQQFTNPTDVDWPVAPNN